MTTVVRVHELGQFLSSDENVAQHRLYLDPGQTTTYTVRIPGPMRISYDIRLSQRPIRAMPLLFVVYEKIYFQDAIPKQINDNIIIRDGDGKDSYMISVSDLSLLMRVTLTNLSGTTIHFRNPKKHQTGNKRRLLGSNLLKKFNIPDDSICFSFGKRLSSMETRLYLKYVARFLKMIPSS